MLVGTELTAVWTITGEDVTEQAAGGALWAIDADTGQELWRREVPIADDERPLLAMAAGEQVLVTTVTPSCAATTCVTARCGGSVHPVTRPRSSTRP